MTTFRYPLPPDDAQEAIPDYELDDPVTRPRSVDYTYDSHDPRPSESYAYPDLHPYVCSCSRNAPRSVIGNLCLDALLGYDLHVTHRYFLVLLMFGDIALAYFTAGL